MFVPYPYGTITVTEICDKGDDVIVRAKEQNADGIQCIHSFSKECCDFDPRVGDRIVIGDDENVEGWVVRKEVDIFRGVNLVDFLSQCDIL